MKTFLYIKPKNNITALGLNAAFFDLLNEHNHITSFLALIHSDIKLDVSKVLFNKILVTKVSIFSPRFLDKDYVKSGDIKEWLSGVGLNNIQINIAYEIINTIFSDKFTDYEICYKEAQKICLELIILLKNLEKLKVDFIYYSSLGNLQNLWSIEISKDMLIKPDIDLNIDNLTLAFLKVMAIYSYEAQYYKVNNIGLGLQDNTCTEVLLCEASIPNTIKEKSSISRYENNHIYKCEVILDKSAVLKKVYDILTDNTYKIHHTYVYDKNLTKKPMLIFFVDEKHKEQITKKILAYSENISYSFASLINICKKTLALEVGLGNKKTICKFYEYIYGNEVIKAKVDDEDLNYYAYEWNENLEHTSNILLSIYHQYTKSIK